MLDDDFLRALKTFLDQHGARAYTEHLSYCGDYGQLYNLMPLPYTEEAVHYVAGRIRHVQDVLERRIRMENVSTYAMSAGDMTELAFRNAVVEEADCGFHLDINNIFVNSRDHGFDAAEYLAGIPAGRVLYAHIAGHFREEDDLRVDTHGEDIATEVWDLLVGRPLVGPTAWNLTYRWPVHSIGPQHLPDAAPDELTHLVVYRDRMGEVHFLQINAVTQRMLQLLKENPAHTGLDVLNAIAAELQHPDPDTVVNAGSALLDDLRHRNVILGTRS